MMKCLVAFLHKTLFHVREREKEMKREREKEMKREREREADGK